MVAGKLDLQKRQHRSVSLPSPSPLSSLISPDNYSSHRTSSLSCPCSERAQPQHRKKLGLLEKHADYVKRARDFHSKEDRIQKLREKAAMRNKDEFYFAMVNSKTKASPLSLSLSSTSSPANPPLRTTTRRKVSTSSREAMNRSRPTL